MASKNDLPAWVHDALKTHRGSAHLVEVAKHIWIHHEPELKASGNLLFTWQYDMRWAANKLRRDGRMKPVSDSPKGVWELA